jgi:hypothetical protein
VHETAYSARLAGSTAQWPDTVNTEGDLKAWLDQVAPPNAKYVISQHNHPGRTEASTQDIAQTKIKAKLMPDRLKYFGEIVTDHTQFSHINVKYGCTSCQT